MTPEEMQRTMQFILDQQARFSVDIDKINETLARHNDAIVGLVQVSRTLIDHQAAGEARMVRIEEKMADLAEAQKELSYAQKAADERLTAFMALVEKYISSRDGGAH